MSELDGQRRKGPVRRVLRIAAFGLGGLVAALALCLGVVFTALQGAPLARLVTEALPDFRGRIELRGLHLSARLLLGLVTDARAPIQVDGLKVWDAEGTLVLAAPRLEVQVQPRSALRLKVYLHDLTLGPGSLWRFAELKQEVVVRNKAGAIALRYRENGFLTAFQPKGTSPGRREEAPVEEVRKAPAIDEEPSGFVLEIVSSNIDGLTATFDFEAWGLELRNLRGSASFTLDDPFVGWDAPSLIARDGGYLRVLKEVLPFDTVHVNRVATTREWPNDIFLDVGAARTGKSTLVAKGFFRGIYGYQGDQTLPGVEMNAAFSHATDALAAVAAQSGIPGLRLAGKDARLIIDLAGAFEALKLDTRLVGLDVAFGAYEARSLAVKAKADLGQPLAVEVEQFAFSPPGGGRFQLDASLRDTAFKARLRLDRFATDSYVPAGLRKEAGGRVSGQLRLAGDFGQRQRGSLSLLDLIFTRTRGGPLPRTVRLRGRASATPDRVATDGVVVEIPGATVSVQGHHSLTNKLVRLALRATATDLPELLARFGLPPLARGAAVSVDVGGSLTNPEARGDAVVRGLRMTDGFPELPELKATFSLEDGTARLDSLAGGLFGGDISGRGEVKLWRGSVERMLRTPVVNLRLEGRQIDLGSLFAYSVVSGRIDLEVEASGPVDKLRGRIHLPPGAELQLFGERWTLDGVDVEVDAQHVAVRTARLRRPWGAQMQIEGEMTFGGDMRWQVDVRGVALKGVPGLKDAGVPIDGRLSARLLATGSLESPALGGEITLAEVAVRGVQLGSAAVTISPAPPAGVTIAGDLFGRFKLDGNAALAPDGMHAQAALSFQRLAVEELVPDVAALVDARGLLSGTVRVAVAPGAPTTVEAIFSELALSVARETRDPSGRLVTRRIGFQNAGIVRALIEGDRLILDPTKLTTEGGALKVQAAVTGEALEGDVDGFLNLELLQPFLPPAVQALSGDVRVGLKLAGTKTQPLATGSVAIASPVRARLRDFEPELTIPSGTIAIEPRRAQLNDLAISVDGATMVLRGRAALDDAFTPREVDLQARGDVSARLLATLSPEAVTESSGRARLDARLWGPLESPEVRARVELKAIEARLRSVGRQISVEDGVLELTTRELQLRSLGLRVDGQGRLQVGPGRVAIRRIALAGPSPGVELGGADFPLRGERLSYSDGDIQIDDLNFDLRLRREGVDPPMLAGRVGIVSGRYVKDFTIDELIIRPGTDESGGGRRGAEPSAVAAMELDLEVRTVSDSFVVQNNYVPAIYMAVNLHIGGTVGSPEISGDVRPTEGRFHIPGLRGDFQLVPNVNFISFVGTKSIAEGDTPEIYFEAESSVPDSFGREHDVRLRITGPIRQMNLALTSSDGLAQGQIPLLMVSGRTTTSSGQGPLIGSNVRTGTDLVGQLSRDSVATLIEPYIADSLALITGQQLNLRPTVGADGLELRLVARRSRKLQLDFSYLQGFQGQRRARAESSLWLADYLTLQFVGEQQRRTPQQGIVETVNSLRLELMLDYPIRLPWL